MASVPADDKELADTLLQAYMQEAPRALFTAALDDDSVELFLDGSWRSTIGLGGASTLSSLFAGYNNIPWTNSVDLLLSLWYAEKWFIEAGIQDELDESTLVLGYLSLDEPGLQKALAGNTRIGFNRRYEGLDFGSPAPGIPGLAFSWGFGQAEYEAMIRLQSATPAEDLFRGNQNLSTESLPLDRTLKGRSFQLPHGNIHDLEVWKEDNTGILASNGRKYRQLGPSELAFVNAEKGMLTLLAPAKESVLVFYRTSGANWHASPGTIPFPELDIDGYLDFSTTFTFNPTGGSPFETNIINRYQTFYGRLVAGLPTGLSGETASIGGKNALVLYRPGETGPYDLQGSYSIGAKLDPGTRGLARISSRIPADGTMEYYLEDAILTLLPGNTGSLLERYPLLDLGTELAKAIYSPARGQDPAGILSLSSKAGGQTRLILSQRALGESIHVYRNGTLDPGFRYDAESGELIPAYPIFPEDELRVIYRVADRLGTERILQVALASNMAFGKYDNLEASLSGSIDLSRLAEGANNAQEGARVQQTVRYSHEDQSFSFSAAARVALQIPDTDGLARVSGFDESRQYPELSPDKLYPLAPWLDTMALERGAQYYRDFRTTTGYLGWNSTQVGSNNTLPDGSSIGPVIAADTDGPRKVAFLPFQVETDKPWVGLALTLDDVDKNSIRTASEIRFWYRYLHGSGTGALELTTLAGTMPEDLDGDGVNDTLAPGVEKGIPFHYGSVTLQTMTQANRATRETGEDRNGNKVLDQGSGKNIISPTFSFTGSDFKEVRIPLDPKTRGQILAGNVLAIQVMHDSGTSMAGTLIVGDISWDGMGTRVIDPANASGAEISTLDGAPGRTQTAELHASFPALGALKESAGESMLKLETTIPGSQITVLEKVFPAVPSMGYRKLAVYFKPSANISSLKAEMIDQNGGVMISHQAFASIPATSWYEIAFFRDKGTVELRGGTSNESTGLINTISGDYDAVIRGLRITMESDINTIYFDELILQDSTLIMDGAYDLRYSQQFENLRLGLGDFTLFSAPKIKAYWTGSAQGEPELPEDIQISSNGTLETAFGILYSDLRIRADIKVEENSHTTRFAHDITLPSSSISPIYFNDAFSQGPGTGDGASFEHGSSIQARFPGLIGIELKAASTEMKNDRSRRYLFNLQNNGTSAFSLLISGKLDDRTSSGLSPSLRYLDDWTNAFSHYFIFDEQAKKSRSMELKGSVSSESEFLDGAFEFESRQEKAQWPGYNKKVALNYGFRLDLDLNADLQSVGLEYRRSGSVTNTSNFYEGLSDEFAAWSRILFDNNSLFLTIPFLDYFDTYQGTDLLGIQTFRGGPRTELTFIRARSLNFVDLYLPRSLTYGISQDTSIDALNAETTTIHNLVLKFISYNTLGRSSSNRLFDWFDSDEINTDLALRYSHGHTPSLTANWAGSYAIIGLAPEETWSTWRSAKGRMEGVYSLPQPFNLTFTGSSQVDVKDSVKSETDLGITWVWAHDLPESWDFRPEDSRKDKPFMVQNEFISLKYAQGALAGNNQTTLEIGHRSIYALPGTAYANLEFAMAGLNLPEPMPDQTWYALAFRIQLDVRVVF